MGDRYKPVQIPHILSETFSQAVNYTEETDDASMDFVICYWKMTPHSDEQIVVKNVIVSDGCIDLVVDFDTHRIGFSGMSKTDFDYKLMLPTRCFGARMKPGAFHQLFGLPATAAMNNFLPINEAIQEFDSATFFEMKFEEAFKYFRTYFVEKIKDKTPNQFVCMFDTFCDSPPATAKEFCTVFKYSQRQLQRLFLVNYGYSPQLALSIMRFQLCLNIIKKTSDLSGILDAVSYYDQAHFNNDFKRNIGLTPLELIRRYKT